MSAIVVHCDFSDCKKFRYRISITWDDTLSSILFIGLNPSIANTVKLDPTVSKCIRMAKNWGYGSISIVNLFSFISPFPKVLFGAEDPIGPENDLWIENELYRHQETIAIWGNHGAYKNRCQSVLEKIERPLCLKRNKTGMPAHPLYLKETVLPFPYIIE